MLERQQIVSLEVLECLCLNQWIWAREGEKLNWNCGNCCSGFTSPNGARFLQPDFPLVLDRARAFRQMS